MTTMKRFLLAALVLLFVPCLTFTSAKADDIYKTGMRMGAVFCPVEPFSCDNLALQSAQIVDAANKCVTQFMGVADSIMHDFESSGEYENCVLPDGNYKTANGGEASVICCVKKSAGDTCRLSCTTFAQIPNH